MLRGDPRGGTGGGTFSLITTAFCRNGGIGAPVVGFWGAVLFTLPPRVSFSAGLCPVDDNGLLAPEPVVVVGATVAVVVVVFAWIRPKILFLAEVDGTPIGSNRLSALIGETIRGEIHLSSMEVGNHFGQYYINKHDCKVKIDQFLSLCSSLLLLKKERTIIRMLLNTHFVFVAMTSQRLLQEIKEIMDEL